MLKIVFIVPHFARYSNGIQFSIYPDLVFQIHPTFHLKTYYVTVFGTREKANRWEKINELNETEKRLQFSNFKEKNVGLKLFEVHEQFSTNTFLITLSEFE